MALRKLNKGIFNWQQLSDYKSQLTDQDALCTTFFIRNRLKRNLYSNSRVLMFQTLKKLQFNSFKKIHISVQKWRKLCFYKKPQRNWELEIIRNWVLIRAKFLLWNVYKKDSAYAAYSLATENLNMNLEIKYISFRRGSCYIIEWRTEVIKECVFTRDARGTLTSV